MKNIIIVLIISIFSSGLVLADYSNNPKCRGYGILQTSEKNNCLEANRGNNATLNNDGSKMQSFKEKAGKLFKGAGLNTDSTLFKTGKYKVK